MPAFGSLGKRNSHATLQGIKRLLAACGVQWSLSDGFPPARAALTGDWRAGEARCKQEPSAWLQRLSHIANDPRIKVFIFRLFSSGGSFVFFSRLHLQLGLKIGAATFLAPYRNL